MIPINFDYYRPDTVEEAVGLYSELDAAGKRPIYYGGGTEIITMARVHNLFTQGVIDIKGIAECMDLGSNGNRLAIGAGVTLTQISESKLWPLQAKTGGRIADHTTQGKITLGGNICGTIIYHEAILPLLLADSEVVIATKEGQRRASIQEVFDQSLRLDKGEFILQFIVEHDYLALPFVHVKRTKSEKIDYPLLSVAAIKREGEIRIAFSGVCAFPFRSNEIEKIINNKDSSIENRVKQVINSLPAPILNDISGSAGYREFVIGNVLQNTLISLEGKMNV